MKTLERAVRAVSEQDAAASAIVDEGVNASLDGSHPVTLQAKMLRLELLKVKADLERDLGRLVLDCSRCGQTVHWVAGNGVSSGHWAHWEPAPASRARRLTRHWRRRTHEVARRDPPTPCGTA